MSSSKPGARPLPPTTPERAIQYLKDSLTSPSVPRLPVEALRSALDVVWALAFLGATEISLAVGTNRVEITWELRDVRIEINLYKEGRMGISGSAIARVSTPTTNIPTVIKAVSGAVDVINYQNMLSAG